MNNPLNKIMQIKQSWDIFTRNHPRFPMFIKAVGNRNVLCKDTIIEISVTTPDGKNYTTNVKLTDEDLQLFENLKNQAL